MRPDEVGDFIAGTAILGVLLGGRIGYALFCNLNETWNRPLSIFEVWKGGMASHGDMIGMILFTLYFSHKHRISGLNLSDNFPIVAPIGLFFGDVRISSMASFTADL